MKTITIKGVAIEATKEDLEKALKEFDKPVWSIKFSGSDLYWLYKNGEAETYIWNRALSFQENYAQLIYNIANAMGVLATKEEMLSLESERIYFDTLKKEFWFDYSRYIYGTTIKDGKASEIVKLLNNSPLMEEFK